MNKRILIVLVAAVAIAAVPHAVAFAEAPVRIASSTAATATTTLSSSDTTALIAQLQALIVSLQTQINELKAKLETTQQEVAVVKAEVQFTAFLAKGAQGDEVTQLQEILKQDPEVYPEGNITGFFGPATEAAVRRFQEKHKIEALGIIGPKTRAKLNDLIAHGAGKSGVIPPGLLRAPGIQQSGTAAAGALSLLASTTQGTAVAAIATTSVATTSPAILCAKDAKYCANKDACAGAGFYWYTVSCHKEPPPAYSCAASYNYCISPTECSVQGWYSCRGSCYPSADACQGEAYVPPAAPAATPAIPATPAQPAQISTSTTDAIPPSVPTNFTATTSQYPIFLYWSKSTDNIGVIGYKLYKNSSLIFSAATSTSLATLSYSDFINITPGTTYNYAVAAYDAAGNISTQAVTSVTTPSSPSSSSPPSSASGSLTISDIRATAYSTGATITWTTSELSYSQIEYSGPSVTGSATTGRFVTGHSMDLYNLYPGTSYTYRVKSGDTAGHLTTSADMTLTTTSAASADMVSPVISNVQTVVSSASATITWQTNELADSQLAYGTTVAYAYNIYTPVDSPFITSHTFGLSGLTAGKTYHYLIISKDPTGNLGASADYAFTTAVALDTTPPAISNIQATGITATSSVITWTTDEASDSQVEYGASTSYGSQTALDATRVTSHSAAITGLTPSTLYHYRVKSKDAAGNPVTSADYTLTTAASPVSLPAPLSMRWNWFGRIRSPDTVQNYQLIIYYSPSAIDAPASFNIYLKKPGESGFTKTNYPKSSLIKYVASSGSEASYSAYPLGNYGVPGDSIPLGEYKVYATAVDSAGIESAPTPTATGNYNPAPVIVNPANGSTQSSLTQINLSDSSSLASPRYTVSLYGANGYIWAPNAFYGSSVTYNGPVLSSANNPHTLVASIFPSGIDPADSSPYTVSTFNIAGSATTTSATAPTASLATILQALSEALATLTRLLEKNQ